MSGTFAYFTPPGSRSDLVIHEMAERLAVTPHARTTHDCLPYAGGIGTTSLGYVGWEPRPVHSADDEQLTRWMVREFFQWRGWRR
jgi:hypothetical protein